MPHVRFTTNLGANAITDCFQYDLAKTVGESLGIDPFYVFVEINNTRISRGEQSPNIALVEVFAIKNVSDAEKNALHTDKITQTITALMDIKKENVLIKYFRMSPEMVGFQGKLAS